MHLVDLGSDKCFIDEHSTLSLAMMSLTHQVVVCDASSCLITQFGELSQEITVFDHLLCIYKKHMTFIH